MLPKYSTFQLNYEQGGLTAPILKDMLYARLITIWIKLLSNSSFWARTERTQIESILYNKRKKTITEILQQSPCKLKGWPEEWRAYLTAWNRFKGKIKTSTTW